MAKVEIMIVVGPNSEEYFLGVFNVEILPRAGEFILCDIGDSVAFEVRYLYHYIKPKSTTKVWISPIDEKEFEAVAAKSGFFSLREAGRKRYPE